MRDHGRDVSQDIVRTRKVVVVAGTVGRLLWLDADLGQGASAASMSSTATATWL